LDSVETAIALKSLKEENASLRALVSELEKATRYRQEQELVDAVKAKVTAWAKWVAGLFVIAATILGVTTFLSARQAVVSGFQSTTEPQLRAKFTDEILPQIKKELESDAARRVDEFTSASTKQFEQEMKRLFDDLANFARENKLQPPERPASIDAQARPTRGWVLKSFLAPSVDKTYLISTFRLNVRDKPNGSIIGRQVQDARVRITEEQGDWARIEVQQ